MKRIALVAALLVSISACSSEQDDSMQESADKAKESASEAVDTAGDAVESAGQAAKDAGENLADKVGDTADRAAQSAHEAAHAALQPLDNGNVRLVGTTGCGHCNFQMGTTCSAAVQSANGAVFILDGVDNDHPLFQKRMDSVKVQVEGKLAHTETGHHILVESYEEL